jgi:predicted  nucleic acid-binding Zn-ribbon protein
MLLDQLSALIRLNDIDSGENSALSVDQATREVERCHQVLSEDVIKEYEMRRDRFGKTAVVPIERGSCSGCNIAIPAVGMEEIAEDISKCPSCDRLVYDPELAFDFV